MLARTQRPGQLEPARAGPDARRDGPTVERHLPLPVSFGLEDRPLEGPFDAEFPDERHLGRQGRSGDGIEPDPECRAERVPRGPPGSLRRRPEDGQRHEGRRRR